MQTLQDQNSLLRAQVNQTPVTNGLLPAAAASAVPAGDHNSITNGNGNILHNDDNNDQKKQKQQTDEEKKQLERELKIRDEIIHELEMRLADVKTPPTTSLPAAAAEGPTKIEVDMLNSQLQALHMTIANKDSELDRIQGELSDEKFKAIEQADLLKAPLAKVTDELKELKGEQDDLLMMLAEQDTKLREYKDKLKALGQDVEEEEDDE